MWFFNCNYLFLLAVCVSRKMTSTKMKIVSKLKDQNDRKKNIIYISTILNGLG